LQLDAGKTNSLDSVSSFCVLRLVLRIIISEIVFFVLSIIRMQFICLFIYLCLFFSGNRDAIQCSKFGSNNFSSYRWNCWRWETNLCYGKEPNDQWRVNMPSNLHFWHWYDS